MPVLSNSPGYAGPSLAAGNFDHFVCGFGFGNKMAEVWKPALSTTGKPTKQMAGKLVSRFLYIIKSQNTLRRYSNSAIFLRFFLDADFNHGLAQIRRIFQRGERRDSLNHGFGTDLHRLTRLQRGLAKGGHCF
jgi:hypothetical protein